MKLTKEELGEDLCDRCRATEFGTVKINTGPWNLCEGVWCDEAYRTYMDEQEDEQ